MSIFGSKPKQSKNSTSNVRFVACVDAVDSSEYGDDVERGLAAHRAERIAQLREQDQIETIQHLPRPVSIRGVKVS